MPTKTYIQPETAIVWRDSGGDYAITLATLAADGVRVGAQGDLGTDSGGRADRYAWQFEVDGFTTAPVVGEAVHIYLSTAMDGSNTVVTGDVGVADAAAATADLPNLMHLGSAIVQEATAGAELVISGEVFLTHRYVSPVVHNDTADILATSTPTHRFTLTPIPYESQ